MSITYEEALNTLKSMFADPWTESTLDAVLRHHNGHMEDTVDTILSHGDNDPKLLLIQLRTAPNQTQMDEQYARQLASQQQEGRVRDASSISVQSSSTTESTPISSQPKGRGIPTTLPPDFLRINSQTPSTSSSYNNTTDTQLEADEQLARMLQDQLFTEELRNNPEFSHLARSNSTNNRGSAAFGGRNLSQMHAANRQQQHQQTRQNDNQDGPGIMEALSDMGETAKNKLALLARKFHDTMSNNSTSSTAASNSATTRVNERRGLLDAQDEMDEQEISFARRSSSDYEMSDFGSSGSYGNSRGKKDE